MCCGRKYLTLSFDDGTIQDIRFVDILNRYGLKCTFNLNSGFWGQKHRIIHDGIDCDHTEIEENQVHDLYLSHEIAVHTVTHPDLLQLNAEQIIREVDDDRKALESLCRYPIVGMAYPGGFCDSEFVIKTIACNTPIRYARTCRNHYAFHFPARPMAWHPTCWIEDPRLMELADAFIRAEPEEDMLFYIWGHSFEFEKYQSWQRLIDFCCFIANRPDIIYATNRACLDAIKP